MCIIVYHPAGAKLPEKKVLERCFEKNNDGAGFMWRRGGEVRCRKGFMDWQEFWGGYRNEKPKEEDEFALHFRWATAGGVRKENCHPFPITQDEGELVELKFRTDRAVMHNGVFGKGERHLSDTMLFVLNELSLLYDYLGEEKIFEYVEYLTRGSRMMLFHEGEFKKMGKWVKEDETGLWYSNEGYKEPEVKAWDRGEYVWWGGTGWRREKGGVLVGESSTTATVPTVVVDNGRQEVKPCPYCNMSDEMYLSKGSPLAFQITCLECGCVYGRWTGKFVGFNGALWESYEKRKSGEEPEVFVSEEDEEEGWGYCKKCNDTRWESAIYDDTVERFFCENCREYF